ncbi:FAD-binding oxidoreductase [Salibacterium aidingense]|uniref:FAD-binding oxidoreductase n=1 Tax=Salibacterium aidingense TaxID=384933 RepID=UPI0004116DB4|nr:FAD-binding oxidoreductase [Salibacterium aidingense]
MTNSWVKRLEEQFGSDVIKWQPSLLKKMSRDFFWYSPVLKEKLSSHYAECVARPRGEMELRGLLSFAAKERIPISTRGGGTGNYGQIVPLNGGIMIDTTKLNSILEIKEGTGRFQAGVKMGQLERKLAGTGQELRFFPSTYQQSTLAGFIAGGTGGIGSINYGTLWDEGNVLELTVLTMEEQPKRLTINGEELKRYIHNYGLSGIMVEVVLSLAPKSEWENLCFQFNTDRQAYIFAEIAALDSDIHKRLISVCEAGLAQVFSPLKEIIEPGKATVFVMAAPDSCKLLTELADELGGDDIEAFGAFLYKKKQDLSHFTWNHVTLWWLKDHPGDTYVQARFSPDRYLRQIELLKKQFPGELLVHLEWIKAGGIIVPTSQTVIRYQNERRLHEIMDAFEEAGVRVSNPHTYVLEEGGKDDCVEMILEAKRENDPYHLLNPGKTNRMRAGTTAGKEE